MIVLKSLDSLNVISMSIVIRMNNLSCSDIVVSDHKVIPCRIQVIITILKCVDSLLMVVKLSEMELLLYIHDFDSSGFICCGKYVSILSHAQCRDTFVEHVDLSDGLFFNSIDNLKISTLSD